jgi:glycosyltransferase involved in cell wall biosynthesis
MAHLNFLVLLLRPFYPQKTAVLVRQNGTVSAALAFGGFARYTRLLYRRLYPRADWVICQTGAMAQDLVAELGIREDRLAVLPNPVEVDEIRRATDCSESQWTGPGPHLLAVGRVSREKGFDLLLRAFASVLEHFPNADLVIAGKGPEEAPLKAQCRQLGLDASVCISGHVPHPSVYFPGATLFVLSSRHEGLPNALLEAAAAGLPIVALPASGGVVDLLRGQPATWLAANISAGALATSLLAALETLLPVERFDHAFVEQFSIERAIPAYQQLIDATLKEAQP